MSSKVNFSTAMPNIMKSIKTDKPDKLSLLKKEHIGRNEPNQILGPISLKDYFHRKQSREASSTQPLIATEKFNSTHGLKGAKFIQQKKMLSRFPYDEKELFSKLSHKKQRSDFGIKL